MAGEDFHSIYSSEHSMWKGTHERPSPPESPHNDAFCAAVQADDARIEAERKALEKQEAKIHDEYVKKLTANLPHPSEMPEPARSAHYNEIWGKLSLSHPVS